ncbi:MAG: hypothetical protein IPK26_28450 [Planctomycetes bacterium]|nr:hypothetical protein [Planctomycetota bacterium]
MHDPIDFVDTFKTLLEQANIRFALTSGMACVHYGLQQTTKDTDWIVAPECLGRLLDALAQQEQRTVPWQVRYRTVFGAPLAIEWMRHGWTCHLALRTEALGFEQHLDFFAQPPRVRHWQPDARGFADRDVVARMKRTDRDKDWPFVDGLGWQMAEQLGEPARAILHVQEAERLRHLWQMLSGDQRATAVVARPMLAMVEKETDLARLEGWVRLERLLWQSVNRLRHERYQRAWKDFYRRWRQEPDWVWPTAEPFLVQHRRVVAAAERHQLPTDAMAGITAAELFEHGLARAAAIAFVPSDTIRAIAPPLGELLP